MNIAPELVELIEASKEEAARSMLVSLPRKCDFAKERQMSLAEVDAWMIKTHRRFQAAVKLVEKM